MLHNIIEKFGSENFNEQYKPWINFLYQIQERAHATWVSRGRDMLKLEMVVLKEAKTQKTYTSKHSYGVLGFVIIHRIWLTPSAPDSTNTKLGQKLNLQGGKQNINHQLVILKEVTEAYMDI